MSLVVRDMPDSSSHSAIYFAYETVTHRGSTWEVWRLMEMTGSLLTDGMMNLHSVRMSLLHLSVSLSVSFSAKESNCQFVCLLLLLFL